MSGWPTVVLQDIATIERDVVDAAAIKGGTVYVGLENIQSGGNFVGVREVDSGELASSKFAFSPRHLLFGKLRPYLAKIARPTFAGVCSTDILPILPGPELDRDYLAHFLLKPDTVALTASQATGANLPRLSPGSLSRLKIPFPPLPEQQRIAAILDKADSLRAKRRAALAQLDIFAQFIFLDMFGNPTTNPKGWTQRLLGDLISVGPQNGLYKPAGDYGTGTPILRIDAFYDGVVTKLASLKRVRLSAEEQQLYALREGEIVINRVNSRAYLGKSALIPSLSETTVFESNMMRFDIDRETLNPCYLIHYLQCSIVRAHINRSAKDAVNQSSINQHDVKAIPIVVPPIAMQRTFAKHLLTHDRLKCSYKASSAGLQALFTSLQHRAFRGELTHVDAQRHVTRPATSNNQKQLRLDVYKGLETLIYVAARTPKHDFYKTLKTIYVADKRHLEHHGRLIYGETHCALPMGPVPQAAFDGAKVLKGEMLVSPFDDDALRAALRRTPRQLIPKREANLEKLSADERESLDAAIRICAPLNFEELKKLTHDAAYHKTPPSQPIRIEHIIEMFPEAAQRRFRASN